MVWGVCGLWVSVFDVFCVLFGVVVLGGCFWPQVSMKCVFVCVLGLVHLVFIGSGYPFVFWGSGFRCVFLQSSFCCVRWCWCLIVEFLCVGSFYSLWLFTTFCSVLVLVCTYSCVPATEESTPGSHFV